MSTHWFQEQMFSPNRNLHTVVDCGKLDDPAARGRVDQLRAAGLGKENVYVFDTGRLLVRLPPTQVQYYLDHFPIKAGTSYFCCTHFWLEET